MQPVQVGLERWGSPWENGAHGGEFRSCPALSWQHLLALCMDTEGHSIQWVSHWVEETELDFRSTEVAAWEAKLHKERTCREMNWKFYIHFPWKHLPTLKVSMHQANLRNQQKVAAWCIKRRPEISAAIRYGGERDQSLRPMKEERHCSIV